MSAGFEARAAFTREADLFTKTWPSALPAVATLLLPLLSESVNPELFQQALVTVDQQNQASLPTLVQETVGGEILLQGTYSGLEFFYAAALGFEAKRISGTLMPEDLGGGAFRHLIEVDTMLRGQPWQAGDGWIASDGLISGQQKLRRGTYVAEKTVTEWEALSCMLNGLALNANGAGMALSTNVQGYSLLLSTSVGNDLTTLLCPTNRIRYQDMTFQLGSIAPLGPGDIVPELTGIGLTIANSLGTVRTKDTGFFIDEPDRVGPVQVSGTFAIPTYLSSNAGISGQLQSGTELFGLIEFTGDAIAASGFDFTLRFWLPSVQITGMDIEIAGPEQLQQNYSFVCARPSATPTGFPDNIKGGPVMIELINDVSQHPLIT